MNNSAPTKVVASLLLASLMAGCANLPQQNGGGQNRQVYQQQNQQSQQNQQARQDPCSVGGTAVAGAAVGTLLGALIDGKKGAVKGAALGGVVGALGCVAVNSQSRQTKTAAQADRDYVKTRGALPAEPQVVSYTPQMSNNVVQRGKPMVIKSTVELVNGSVTPITEVREEMVVYDTHGEQIRSKDKPLVNRSGGRFENSFELSLPQQAPQGVYTIKTNLYVNDKLMARRDMSTQLVWNGASGTMLAVR
ncbi:MAG: hypothetical protein ABW069_13785 [Duganella sp.]